MLLMLNICILIEVMSLIGYYLIAEMLLAMICHYHTHAAIQQFAPYVNVRGCLCRSGFLLIHSRWATFKAPAV